MLKRTLNSKSTFNFTLESDLKKKFEPDVFTKKSKIKTVVFFKNFQKLIFWSKMDFFGRKIVFFHQKSLKYHIFFNHKCRKNDSLQN